MRVRLYEPKSSLLAILLNLAFVVALCLAFLLIVREAYSIQPEPDYGEIKDFGCKVFQDSRFNGRYQVVVWADYRYRQGAEKPEKARRWETLYAIRETRKDALKDCNEWMDKVDKQIKRAK